MRPLAIIICLFYVFAYVLSALFKECGVSLFVHIVFDRTALLWVWRSFLLFFFVLCSISTALAPLRCDVYSFFVFLLAFSVVLSFCLGHF